MRLFTLCIYLKTKESYDRWITRRVWGFRHQISKAKYPKISQKVGWKYQEGSGEHRCTVYWEKNSVGKRYQKVRICISGEVEASSSPIRLWDIGGRNSGCENVGARNSSPGGLSYAVQGGPCARCRDPSPRWHGVRKAIWINSIRIPQEDMWRTPLSRSTLHSWISHPDDSISYPDGKHWLKWACLATAHVPPPSDGVSGHLCHGFQRTLLNLWLLLWSKSYQNTKT